MQFSQLAITNCNHITCDVYFEGARAVPGPGTTPGGFPFGTGTIILDNLSCTGNESSLFECHQRNDCDVGEQAGLVCQSDGKAWSYNVLVQDSLS